MAQEKTTHVILLRGVMPTGKNKVAMAQFRLMLEQLGFTHVRTYIQSGNALVSSHLANQKIEEKVALSLKKELGADIKVFARTTSEFKKILKNCPFQNLKAENHYFTLLSEIPSSSAKKWFSEMDFSPDKMFLKGDMIYAEYSTRISDSRFNNNYFERKLSMVATTRNSNTMVKLLEMASGKK
jgi:uncharacterized protein (DUF1697 family)